MEARGGVVDVSSEPSRKVGVKRKKRGLGRKRRPTADRGGFHEIAPPPLTTRFTLLPA